MDTVAIFASRRRVEAEVLKKADRILEFRRWLSPAMSHLVRHNLFDENLDFVHWDKKLWDLHDNLMREHARLVAGESPRRVLQKTRAATTALENALAEVEQFKSRPWWADVAFERA